MAVKNTETGEVHRGQKGSTTECGFETNATHWISSYEPITCEKDGCK